MRKVTTKTPFLILILLALTLAWSASAVFADGDKGQARAVAAQGVITLDGEDVIVEILVAVRPGENAQAAAQAALKRAYPDVRDIDSADFSLTGLVWDVFSDGNPGNDQVVVNYNGNGVPGNLSNLDHRGTWSNSMATWTNVSASSFVFYDGGDTGRCPSLVKECKGRQKFDGNNDVGWIDIADPSVLGVTWYGTITDEFDMALDNKNFSWYIGDPTNIPDNAFDTETVWLHEFGHGVGLGHSNVDGAVMEPFYEEVRRALHQDDKDGISFLYPSGAITPATLEVTTTSVPNGTDDVGYDVTLEATGGTLLYTWAITSGLLPTGLILNTSTGEISGTPNTMGTSNFTVKVTDNSDPAQSDSQALSIIIDEAPQAGSSVIVDFVTYDTEGGKDGNKHLSITITLVDDLGGGVSGASVSITLTNDTSGGPWVGSGTTGDSGTVTFSLKNAPSGCYLTTVDSISAGSLTWNNTTPGNQLCK